MPAGRPPKPTAIKQLEGNLGGRPLNPDEPKPNTACPQMPDLPADAAEFWHQLAPQLHRLGLLTSVDAGALESFCRLSAYARACWAKVEEMGPIVSIDHKPTVNPYSREAQRAETLLAKLRHELGLNPSSRGRMHTTPSEPDEQDPLAFPL